VATPGALTIQVTPSDAKVSVDGKELSGGSPFVSSVAPGKHQVKISHPAHLDFATEVEVTEAGLSVPITLQPKAVKLSFELVPAEASASVLSGGQLIGTGNNGGPLTVVRNPEMTYEVEVSAPGYTSLRLPLTFTGEATQNVPAKLVKTVADAGSVVPVKPDGGGGIKKNGGGGGGGGGGGRPKAPTLAKTATLKIGTNPGVPPAKVSVDGKPAGQTPVKALAVTPGKHTVKFTWDSGRSPVTETVTVGDGQTALVKGG
jgi:hypothetical protein